MKKFYLFPPCGFLLFCLLTIGFGLPAQGVEQLTNLRADGVRRNHVQQMAVFEGRIYSANRPVNQDDKGRFSRIDPQTGSYTPLRERGEYLGGAGQVSDFTTFQELDGKLFAQVRVAGSGVELFRIEGDSTFRLTDLIKDPVSELVQFQGEYYFLVLGRPYEVVESGRYDMAYLELWKTDGTAAGTALVEELPILHRDNNFFDRATIAAGAESLLIGGQSLNDPYTWYTAFYQYRPGKGTSRVTAPGHPAANLQHPKDGTPRVAFFAGGYYISGSIESETYAQPEVFRIEEATGVMHEIPGLLDGDYGSSFSDNVSYAVVGDSLYLHAVKQNMGYALYAAGTERPDQFRRITWVSSLALNAPLVEREGKLYFGGATDLYYYIVMRYVPGEDQPEPLFNLFNVLPRARLYVGDDIIYAVTDKRSENTIARYRPSDLALKIFEGIAEGYPEMSAQLYGEDLIFLGKPNDGTPSYSEAEPYLLESEAAAPRVLAPIDPAAPLGVARVFRRVKDGRLLITGQDASLTGEYQLYNETNGTVSSVTYAPVGTTSESPLYLNSIDGEAIFFNYNYDDGQFYLYTLQGDSLHMVIDAATERPFASDNLPALQGKRIHYEKQTESPHSYNLVRYSFAGNVMTREVVYRPTRRYNSISIGSQYIKYGEYGENQHFNQLFHVDGRKAYDFNYPANGTLVTADSTGYYLFFTSLTEEPSLEFHDPHTGTQVKFSFPEGVTFDPTTLVHKLGNRLIFRPYDPSVGRELFAADPSTGRIQHLADIYPGTAGSGPYSEIVVQDRLFFTAYDPTHGLELWRTDGTPTGTYLMADINAGAKSSHPKRFYRGDSILYFSASGPAGEEVYGVQLRDESVHLVADINPGTGGSYPMNFLEEDSTLYVVALPARGEAPQLFRLSQGVLSPVKEASLPAGHLALFPNPATDWVTLQPEAGESLSRIRLYDGSGRLLRDERTDTDSYTLPLHGLNSGRYVTVVQYSSGRQRAASLVIVR